jgi:hypothetical protein
MRVKIEPDRRSECPCFESMIALSRIAQHDPLCSGVIISETMKSRSKSRYTIGFNKEMRFAIAIPRTAGAYRS